MDFKLDSKYSKTLAQKKAIDKLVKGIEEGLKYQVLLGVTGSGKTFTVANIIERLQRPALIVSHNKTLAAQLYQEFKSFFPDNAISYFVSYYDFYQPEAYIPSTDTYIEKDADINEYIDKLRLASTTNLLTRKDSLVVASVSCIYNIGSPDEYGSSTVNFNVNADFVRHEVIEKLVNLQYERAEFGFRRGTFRVRGNTFDIYPAYQDLAVRIEIVEDKVSKITFIDPVSGEYVSNEGNPHSFTVYPAKHYILDPIKYKNIFQIIEDDLEKRCLVLKKGGKELESFRLKQKVKYDLEMIKEIGYVKGIENYSRYFDGRNPGDPPYTLLDFFPVCASNNETLKRNEWLVFVDESHITFPQIRGMYAGDLSRKQTLVDYGFRLPSALDNRPLQFSEFMRRIPNFIGTSATPGAWELSLAKDSYDSLSDIKKKRISKNGLTELLVRPTGIPDPKVYIRKASTQVKDVISEIEKRVIKGQRTLVTTVTKKTAEDLSNYLSEKGIKVHYLHSDIKTLERSDILDNLRKGVYNAIVGVNLLREGLDLPEVALVAILDADKEGFLRSEVSLIQTMGRAARNIEGEVILYAGSETGSIKRALKEIGRRRNYQLKYNKLMGITPSTVIKPIREKLFDLDSFTEDELDKKSSTFKKTLNINTNFLTPYDLKKLISNLRKEMKIAANEMNFELAIEIRDKIRELA